MLNSWDVPKIDAVMELGSPDSNDRTSWERIKKELEELTKTSTNKAMPKFPKYGDAEAEFLKWWHAKNPGDNTLSYRNMHEFYDIIVGNYRQ